MASSTPARRRRADDNAGKDHELMAIFHGHEPYKKGTLHKKNSHVPTYLLDEDACELLCFGRLSKTIAGRVGRKIPLQELYYIPGTLSYS